MTAFEIAQISKYMTIWFKKTPRGYSDFREIPTEYALEIAEKIKQNTRHDKEIDSEFGSGFSAYLRDVMIIEEEPMPKKATIDKFG